jgi:hypothetical protein
MFDHLYPELFAVYQTIPLVFAHVDYICKIWINFHKMQQLFFVILSPFTFWPRNASYILRACCFIRDKTSVHKTSFSKIIEFSIKQNIAVKPSHDRVPSQ